MTRDTLPRIRNGILILFFAMGFASSATATRLAEIKLRIGSGDAIFGYALAAGAIGGTLGNWIAHRLIHKFGSRRIARTSGSIMMLVIASNGVINQAWQLALTSLGISFCYSVTNVAMNSQGVDLEVQLKKSLMPRFHAGWSTGSFTTAVLGAVVAAVLTPTVHLSAIGITATLLVWLGTSMMSPTDHKDDSHVAQHEKIPADVRKRIVFISFAMSLGLIAEVSVFDWSSIYMHETLGLALGVNALGVTCFYAIQIVMRAFIGSVQDRYGIAKVVRRVGLFAGITYLGILLVTNLVNSAENAANSTLLTILAGASFGAVAIGVAAMPAAFLTAAGRIPQLSTARGIAAVAMTNAFFILLFKTIVSTIAGSAGLPIALMCTACGLLAASFLSGILESDLPVATTLPS